MAKSEKVLAQDARDILKKKLTASFGDAMPAVVKAIDTDINKVDRLIELLEQFRNDLFYVGLKNLSRGEVCIPDHKGEEDDYPIAFWDFNDKFRHRTYRLKYDFNNGSYSAWGVQMHETIPVCIGSVPVTEEMLADLCSMVKAEHKARIERMQAVWDKRRSTAMTSQKVVVPIGQRS